MSCTGAWRTDDRIVVLGEDVHRLKGGTNGATRGLAPAFPDRVLGTPISENAFAAWRRHRRGRPLRPVVEFMYADFMWVAADQVFNQIGKARHMFGGDSEMPLVLRTKVAMGTGYGSQHSMDPAGIFATAPGWRIVAPSTPFDYVGPDEQRATLQGSRARHRACRSLRFHRPRAADDLDYFIPLGKAKSCRRGAAMTVLTYLTMVQRSLEAVERLGADEVIDLRWLDRASLDWDLIEESVCRTNNVIVGAGGTRHLLWRLARG